jgi:hypothetical protein
MDNYYMSTTTAIKFREKIVFCCGTIQSNRKLLLPKSVPLTATDVRWLGRGHSVCAVNRDNNLLAIGWLENKPVNFNSTLDTTKVVNIMRRIRNLKVLIPAPQTVARYNRFLGGVDKHNKLRSKFSLGE